MPLWTKFDILWYNYFTCKGLTINNKFNKTMKNKKGNAAVIAVIVVIVAITAGVIGWMFAKKTQVPAAQSVATQPTAPTTQIQSAAQPITPVTQPTGQSVVTYISPRYGFEFNYPKGTIIEESGNNVKIIDSRSNGVKYEWNIKVFENKNLNNDLKGWFYSTFDKIKNKDCKVQESNYIIKDANTLLIDSGSMEDACADGGYYTMNSNKSLVVKWEFGQDAMDTELFTSTFKFTN
jgi:hypothetical protein